MGSFLARLRAGSAVLCAAFLISAPALAAASGARTAAPHGGQEALDAAEEAREHVRIEGSVLLPGGGPARGAVVVSSAGGQAAAGDDGSFALEIALSPGAQAVELTAVASDGRGTQIAHRRVEGLAGTGVRDAGTLVLALVEGCAPDWIPTFGEQAGISGLNAQADALAVYDDGLGAGPALYVAGYFTQAGAKTVKHIARWDGEHWSSLGSGLNGGVFALAVFDDGSGSGPALYAGGVFGLAGGQSAKHIARWDGQSWSALGEGVNGYVRALTVHDDGSGSGPALYAGGAFGKAGAFPASCIARWSGQHWSPLGSGVNDPVLALTVFDDGAGGGPALYAGGEFKSAGTVGVNYIARWDGQGWSSLANGMDHEVRALTVFDDGSGGGPALYAGGDFSSAGGTPASRIARWDGQQWHPLGAGLDASVQALTVFDDGSGPALYAGEDGVARWNGASWEHLPGLEESVRAMAVFDGGPGGQPALYDGNQSITGIAKWDGKAWSPLGSGLNDTVYCLAVFDEGSGGGPALYAGGDFTLAGDDAQPYIARWDGQLWSSVGGGMDGTVRALTVLDDGTGPALYAGGDFSSAGGTPASGIARWDGQQWHPLGVGLIGSVRALTGFDDGSGPALHAGGLLYSVPGIEPRHIAKWDGEVWSAVGGGADTWVLALTVFDDGSGAGPALYAGGHFTSIGGSPIAYIARWDGQDWSALGSGLELGSSIRALAVHDDGAGGGPALYAGGSTLVRWDGLTWSPLGGGLGFPFPSGGVDAFAVFDDGTGGGPALYAGGWFYFVSSSNDNIARWNGQGWSPLGSGMQERVQALTVFDDGSGPALQVGGWFLGSPAGDSYLAHWGCPATVATVPGCFGNPAALVSLSDEAALGSAFSVSLSPSQLATGFGLLYLGAEGTDASGCGVLATGLGELLLALLPLPAQVEAGHLSSGEVTFDLPVPDDAALVGIEVAFQGVVVGAFDPGVPIELSNALLVTVAP